MRMNRSIPVVLLALAGVSAPGAAAIPFFVPGTQTGTVQMSIDETRETLFQALNNVTLAMVGPVPLAHFQFRFVVYFRLLDL
jgi:hypothetical protein